MQADETSIFSDGAAGGAAAPAAPDAVPLSALVAEAAELRAALADTSENRILERIAQHPDITLEQLARPVAHTPRAALPIADQPLGDGDATAHVRAGEVLKPRARRDGLFEMALCLWQRPRPAGPGLRRVRPYSEWPNAKRPSDRGASGRRRGSGLRAGAREHGPLSGAELGVAIKRAAMGAPAGSPSLAGCVATGDGGGELVAANAKVAAEAGGHVTKVVT